VGEEGCGGGGVGGGRREEDGERTTQETVKTSWVCSVSFFIMIYLCYTMYILRIYIV
jgi:hypothetical protein